MTLKRFAAEQFYSALHEYRQALQSKDPHQIVTSSLKVYAARRDQHDHAAINRAFKEETAS